MLLRVLIGILALSTAAHSDEAEDAFVEANILGIFYHELGHAVIDTEDVPIFAQEEDAADVFSILMIDMLFDEETARSLAFDAAFGFKGEAEARRAAREEVAWWDVHGVDEQRYYNTVCLFYGADPDQRADFAQELGLPEDRADYCPGEFDQANAAWGLIIDEMIAREPEDTLLLLPGEGSLTETILTEEVAALNADFTLSTSIDVAIEPCGEANAFYDPEEKLIIMCTEFEDHLRQIFRAL